MSGRYRMILSPFLATAVGGGAQVVTEFESVGAAIEAAKDVIDRLIQAQYDRDADANPAGLEEALAEFDYLPFVGGPDARRVDTDFRHYARARCYELAGTTTPCRSVYGQILASTGRDIREVRNGKYSA